MADRVAQPRQLSNASHETEQKGQLRVVLIVPVAKEGGQLYGRIRRFYDELASLLKPFDFHIGVVLVTDVFHKPTLEAMMALAKEGVARAIFLTKRVGKGGSVKNAAIYTCGDYLVLLDADTPVLPKVVADAILLASRKGLDLLITIRAHRTHGTLRKVLSTAYNLLASALFKTGVRDHQAGFKILSKKAAKIILVGRVRTDGLAYDTEVIVWAKKHGLKLGTVEVAWIEQREKSTIPTARATLTMLADLIALRLLTLASKYAALRRVPVGTVIDLGQLRRIGREYVTVIEAAGPKRHIFEALRKLYTAIAFREGL